MTDHFRFFKRMNKSKKKAAITETSSVTSHQEISATTQTPPPKPSSSPLTAATATAAAAAEATSAKTTPRKSLGSDHLANPNYHQRLIMDEELSRMRGELSRSVTTCEKRGAEAARAATDLQHCKEELARVSAVKMEVDHDNRKLQAEVSSLEREKARLLSEVERLREDLQRMKTKLADKKRAVTDLKKHLQRMEEEKGEVERSTKEREQTWSTIRRDVSTRRDDAIRETGKLRRENDKLKSRIMKLKSEKSSILLRIWEKKQTEGSNPRPETSSRFSADGKETRSRHGHEEERLPAKILSLELQLFRQARLVELLLDVIQSYDPQFTAQQRRDLTSAFADTGSIPEMMSRKVTFAEC